MLDCRFAEWIAALTRLQITEKILHWMFEFETIVAAGLALGRENRSLGGDNVGRN
jgi:hypothetical protein